MSLARLMTRLAGMYREAPAEVARVKGYRLARAITPGARRAQTYIFASAILIVSDHRGGFPTAM